MNNNCFTTRNTKRAKLRIIEVSLFRSLLLRIILLINSLAYFLMRTYVLILDLELAYREFLLQPKHEDSYHSHYGFNKLTIQLKVKIKEESDEHYEILRIFNYL